MPTLGLDIVNQPSKVISPSFGDLGGLNQAIRKFIKYDEGFTEKEKHLVLTDFVSLGSSSWDNNKPNQN